MRRTPVLLTALLLAAFPFPGQSQTTKPDPFEGHHLLRDRQQIVVLKTYPYLAQQTYNFTYLPGVGDTMLAGPAHQYPDSLQELFQNNKDGGVDLFVELDVEEFHRGHAWLVLVNALDG